MGVFARGNKLWITFKDSDGKWKNRPTGLDVGQEELAQAAYQEVVSRVKTASSKTGEPGTQNGECLRCFCFRCRVAHHPASKTGSKPRLRMFLDQDEEMQELFPRLIKSDGLYAFEGEELLVVVASIPRDRKTERELKYFIDHQLGVPVENGGLF